MMVMTMILTRLTAKSSRVGYVCVNLAVQKIFRHGFTRMNTDRSVNIRVNPWLIYQRNRTVYVTRSPRPISGANSLINERWLR